MPPMHQPSRGREPDLRELLLRAGVGSYTAVMSIPYMNMLPNTTDPYAQGVQQIVQGLQRLLVQRGARLVVDGGMGERTVRALMTWSGPRWYDKSWAQLYGDVIAGQPWKGFERNDRTPAHQDHLDPGVVEELGGSLVGDVFASPLALIGGAALAIWAWKNRKSLSRRFA